MVKWCQILRSGKSRQAVIICDAWSKEITAGLPTFYAGVFSAGYKYNTAFYWFKDDKKKAYILYGQKLGQLNILMNNIMQALMKRWTS